MELAQTKAWLTALNRLRKMAVDAVVPGHGSICDREGTHALSNYIRRMRALVRRAFQAGRSKSDTSKVVVPRFLDAFPHDEEESERTRARVKGGSDRIYDEYRIAAKVRAGREVRGRARRKRKAAALTGP
jgi:hypothetical protein